MNLADDRMAVELELKDFGKGEKWLDRIYHIHIPYTKEMFGDAPVWKKLESYFTLRAIH